MKSITTYLVIGLMLFSGCEFFQPKEDADKGKVLARVKGRYLYKDDIKDLGLKMATAEDSAKITSEFIENWVRQQLKLEYAYENLPPEKLEIQKQIQDYKESLIIYIYESEYLKQNLDTTITEQQLTEFYTQNIDNFLLGSDLVQMTFVKMPESSPDQDSLRTWMTKYNQESKGRIQQYAYDYAMNYNLNDSSWFDRQNIRLNISAKMAESYDLSRSRVIEVQDSSFVIFARINDFKIKESKAPFSFVRDQVKRMIINKRKLRLKHQFTENILQNATEQNIYEIYK